MLRLYHVSRNINKREYFQPRVPMYSNVRESNLNRICLSSSIEGAISATFYHWFSRENIISNTGEVYFKKEKRLKFLPFSEALIYEFDTRNIESENIIVPIEVKNQNVYDAEFTKEYWVINQSIIPIKTKLIKLKYCNYSTKFRFIDKHPYEFHHISQLEFRKIKSIDEYLDQINNHYDNDRLNREKDKAYRELVTQIVTRESDNCVTRLFLNKVKYMEENNIVEFKSSIELERDYFSNNE